MSLTTIAVAVAATATFAFGLAVGSGVGYQLQASRIASIQLELKNEQLDRANERIAIQRAARATLERNMQAVSKAQDVAASRLVAIAADRDRAHSQLDRLRDTSAAAVRNASAGIDACTSAVATYDQLFTGCSARLVEVAGDADSWASSTVMMQDAWPK